MKQRTTNEIQSTSFVDSFSELGHVGLTESDNKLNGRN